MKKFYKIILLLLVLIFLSTYNPKELNFTTNKNEYFFKIKNIEVNNNILIGSDKILSELNEIYNQNIFLIKKSDIQKPLKNMNFLKEIEVKKKYPNTVLIKIIETKPIAILYKKKSKYLLDSSSNLIVYSDSFNFSGLPELFGENAENNFITFLNLLKKNNFDTEKIKNFYYFQIGRWDIELKNDKIIKFPDKNIKKTITKYIELLNNENFENYNTIDLRVEGKIIVE